MKKLFTLLIALLVAFCLFTGCELSNFLPTDSSSLSSTNQQVSSISNLTQNSKVNQTSKSEQTSLSPVHADLKNIPAFTNQPYVIINDNVPFFKDDEKITTSFERFDDLDSLGRCGVTYACIGKDLMPTEERGEIGMIKPSGWQSVKYDCVSGKYLYNRCHLIGFQLTGENANEKNLITGTRYLNIDGMLPFEDMVADYVKETNNHVLYRVTPIFEGNNLLASGVLMEGYSVEDNGDGICYNVYCYNAQPQITIDYATGNSWLSTDKPANSQTNSVVGSASISTSSPSTSVIISSSTAESLTTYVLNTNTKKFHLPTCSSASSMSSANRAEQTTTRQNLIDNGYSPCSLCKP